MKNELRGYLSLDDRIDITKYKPGEEFFLFEETKLGMVKVKFVVIRREPKRKRMLVEKLPN